MAELVVADRLLMVASVVVGLLLTQVLVAADLQLMAELVVVRNTPKPRIGDQHGNAHL